MASTDSSKKTKRSARIFWILVALSVLCVYLLANYGYAQSGRTTLESGPAPVSNGVNFGMKMLAVKTSTHEVTLRVMKIPAGDFVDERSDTWAKSIRITIPSVTSGSPTTTIMAGDDAGGGAQDFSVPIDGDSATYPFAEYRYGMSPEDAPDPEAAPITEPLALLTVQEIDGAGVPTNTDVPIGWLPPEGMEGWSEKWTATAANNTLSLLLAVKQSGPVVGFILALLGLMVVIAVVASLVARSVVLKRRPIEATMASWFAALLFAIIPLRNSLPDSPPLGVWIDVAVFYWVEVAVLISMLVFVGSWLKYRKPPVDDGS